MSGMKNPVSFRLSPTALKIINKWSKKWAIPKTAVVEIALRNIESLKP